MNEIDGIYIDAQYVMMSVIVYKWTGMKSQKQIPISYNYTQERLR